METPRGRIGLCAADVLRPEYALAPAILTAVLLALAHQQQQQGLAPQPLWLMALHTSRVVEAQATVRTRVVARRPRRLDRLTIAQLTGLTACGGRCVLFGGRFD
jgi:hypothetical protein